METAKPNYPTTVVSELVSDFINLEKSNFNVILSKDITATTLSILSNRGEEAVRILFLLSPEEYLELERDFLQSETDNLYYLVALIARREDIPPQLFFKPPVIDIRTSPVTGVEFTFLMEKARSSFNEMLAGRDRKGKEQISLKDALNDQEALIEIGRSLTLEKDPDKLLRKILMHSKKITGADAGSIFILEEENGEKRLRFKYSHTFSKPMHLEEFTLPLDTKSIAGYVGVTGEALNIPDVYKLEANSKISFNPSYDRQHGYRTKSMLVVPMRNHLDQIIGVIQLINSKEPVEGSEGNEAFEVKLEKPEDFEKKVKPFAHRYRNLMEAVAAQAAIALENNRMLLQIEHQFEEFVKASVTAIESRDPATSGHSFRVADLCVKIANIINKTTEGPFADVTFSDTQLKELEFAGLLHDFGKVYIDPSIFLKSKKLFPKDFEYLMMRLNFLFRTLELKYCQEYSKPNLSSEARKEKERKLEKLRQIMRSVSDLNEPTVQIGDPETRIREILETQRELQCYDLEGKIIPVLDDNEVFNLKIKKGSLNEKERKIIESHVEHTYVFVSKIPWPDEYKKIPEIALKHHEKLDGTGYPHGVKGKEQIPLESRIMAVADIYDALTASDRPYKKCVPMDKIITILREEANSGKVDPDVVELFIKEILSTESAGPKF
ncbi:MAG: HD family phosphohydrolase [Spirochaetes bacterium]|nr:MAG: HD family phosphohydrolase [Spirochaetota bacterium]